MNITKNFERKYTGLDTLIRLDGYYYYEYYDIDNNYNKYQEYYKDSISLFIRTIIFSKNSEVIRLQSVRTHKEIQNLIDESNYPSRSFYGNYTIKNDTINVELALCLSPRFKFYSNSDEIYLIENDITLRRIWSFNRSDSFDLPVHRIRKEKEAIKNEIYRFYKYP